MQVFSVMIIFAFLFFRLEVIFFVTCISKSVFVSLSHKVSFILI